MMAGARLAFLALVDTAVLVVARPDRALWHDLGAPRAWLDRVGADTAAARLAGAGLWIVAVWLGIGVLAVLTSELPGGVGRSAARLAAVALPHVVLRMLAGAAGLGVLIAPVAATAQRAPSAPTAPAWPSSAAPTAPAWPTAAPARAPAPRPASRHSPADHPAHHPAHHPVNRPAAHPARGPARRVPVSVRAGDSLWSIAADHLPAGHRSPARVAASWPRWYAANRGVIGADPDHIETGQHLIPPHPPTAPRTEPGR